MTKKRESATTRMTRSAKAALRRIIPRKNREEEDEEEELQKGKEIAVDDEEDDEEDDADDCQAKKGKGPKRKGRKSAATRAKNLDDEDYPPKKGKKKGTKGTQRAATRAGEIVTMIEEAVEKLGSDADGEGLEILNKVLEFVRRSMHSSLMRTLSPFNTKNTDMTPEILEHINPFLTMTIDDGVNDEFVPSYALVWSKTEFTMPLEVLNFVIDHCVVSPVGFAESVYRVSRTSNEFAIRPTHLAMTAGIRLVTKVSDEFKTYVRGLKMVLHPEQSGVKRPRRSWLFCGTEEAALVPKIYAGDEEAYKLVKKRFKSVLQEAKFRKRGLDHSLDSEPPEDNARSLPIQGRSDDGHSDEEVERPPDSPRHWSAAPDAINLRWNPYPVPANPGTATEDVLHEDLNVDFTTVKSSDEQCLAGFDGLQEPSPRGVDELLKPGIPPVHSRNESSDSHASGNAEHESFENDITFSVKVIHRGKGYKTFVLLIECKTDGTLLSPQALCQAVSSVLHRALADLPFQQDVHLLVVGKTVWQYGVVRLYGKVKVTRSKVTGFKILKSMEADSEVPSVEELQRRLDTRRSLLQEEFELSNYVDGDYILADAFISRKERLVYDGKKTVDAYLFYETLLLIICGKKARGWSLTHVQEIHKERVAWEAEKDRLRSTAQAFGVFHIPGDDPTPNMSGYCRACFQGLGYKF